LIVDDDASARSFVAEVLGDGHRCEQASSAAEARTKIAGHEFDLVFCDVNPSDESGWALPGEIFAAHPRTSIVFVTDEDDLRLAQQAFEFGAYGYLIKPYRPGELLITVMNALKRHELEIAREQQRQVLLQQLQTVIDHAPLRIYLKDRNYRFIAINRAACEPTGQLPEDLIGKTMEAIASPEAAELSRVGDQKVLEEGVAYEAEETMQLGGESRTLMTSKFPLLDDQGNVYAVCGISADITAVKQAQELREELVVAQQNAIEELRASRQESVERLARVVELRDTETGEHINRMARISGFLGRSMGLDEAGVDALFAAAPMHDVGKIGIADEILLKPGALTAQERTEMERHTTVGHELLADSHSFVLQMAATIALTHHERWDGTGYPRGLAQKAIPLEGRIAAVADVFDALLSDRPYRPSMSLDEALGIIEKGRGTHFDPEIADRLLAHVHEVVSLRGDAPDPESSTRL
jgi:PAS domain S-box-containing protein